MKPDEKPEIPPLRRCTCGKKPKVEICADGVFIYCAGKECGCDSLYATTLERAVQQWNENL